MSELVLSYLDVTKLAVASFLARYREPILGSYRVDLRCYLRDAPRLMSTPSGSPEGSSSSTSAHWKRPTTRRPRSPAASAPSQRS